MSPGPAAGSLFNRAWHPFTEMMYKFFAPELSAQLTTAPTGYKQGLSLLFKEREGVERERYQTKRHAVLLTVHVHGTYWQLCQFLSAFLKASGTVVPFVAIVLIYLILGGR